MRWNWKLIFIVFVVIVILTSPVATSAQDNQLKLVTNDKLTKVSQFNLKYYTQIIKSGVFSYVTNRANVQQTSSTPLIDNSSSQKKFVEFIQPIDQYKLSLFVKTSQIIPEEIIFAQGEVRGGYTLKSGESVDSAIKNLKDKHLEFLNYATSNTLTEIGNTKSLIDLNRLNDLNIILSRAKTETVNGNIKITAFVGNKADAKISISPDLLIKSVTDYNIIPKEVINPKAAKITSSSYYVKPTLWYPTKGSTKTNKFMAFNTFYFNDASGFDSFDGILTYEHETQIYDANFSDYDNYWSSNLPYAYKDTQASDSSAIDNFTIGSAKASDIVENKQYYTNMSLKGGSASTATVRIKSQMGHRILDSCYRTWCIFPDMTTPTLKMYTAPISTQLFWTYNP